MMTLSLRLLRKVTVNSKQKNRIFSSMSRSNKRQKTERFVVPKDDLSKRVVLTDDLLKGRQQCKIISVNVPGIRALLKSEDRKKHLTDLMDSEDPDIFLIQEHKLQAKHIKEEKLVVDFIENDMKDYEGYWTFSEAKKGYSGVASFVKKSFTKHTPVKSVSYKLSDSGHVFDNEGRVVILNFEKFSIFNLYVPNSGMKLQRLDDRTKKWDKTLLTCFRNMEKPFLSIGDYNVAFRIKDMHNFYHKGHLDDACKMETGESQYKGVRNLLKLAGCTVQERLSFAKILDSGCVVDSFIKLHGDVKGRFTYWSQRSNNRPFNQGLRLDYVLATPDMFTSKDSSIELLDVFHLDDTSFSDWALSDHCPVGASIAF